MGLTFTPTSAANEAMIVKRTGHCIHRLVTLCGSITGLVAEHDCRLTAVADNDGRNSPPPHPKR